MLSLAVKYNIVITTKVSKCGLFKNEISKLILYLYRRRSKSLDDIIIKKDGDRLSCYQDTFTSTSPIVTIHDIPPKRRHSVCNHEPHQRLATIYGWVTTAKPR